MLEKQGVEFVERRGGEAGLRLGQHHHSEYVSITPGHFHNPKMTSDWRNNLAAQREEGHCEPYT